MKKVNWTLIIGGFIIGLIIIVMLFPELFTRINPYGSQYISSTGQAGGSSILSSPPYPPSKKYLLGSDMLGRDIFSLIIYGTRLTITLGFCVVIGRFILAIPLGLGAGFGNRICKTIISQFSIVFSSIPILIISFIVLSMPFFSNLYKRESVIAFTIVLTIVGFGKLGQMIEERVENILTRAFIKGEMAIGKSKKRIAIENVIPHLSAELIVIFFMEFAAALSLIMQLGIFNVFVGNLRILEDKALVGVPVLPLSFEPEWASMLGAARTNLISSPWTIISPAIAFTISIFGFNIFAEGLRKILHKRDSNFIPLIRRSLSFEKSNLKLSNLHPIKGKFKLVSIIIIGILTYIIVLNISNMKYKFDSQSIPYSANNSEVIVGSKEADTTAKVIAGEFKDNGFKPISSKGYIIPYDIANEYYCYYGNAKFEADKNSYDLGLGKDFSPGSFGNYDFSGKIYDSTALDLFSLKDYSKFNNKIVLLNGNIYSDNAMLYIANEIIKNSSAKGILVLGKNGTKLPQIFGNTVLKFPLLWITQDIFDKINNSKDSNLSVAIRCRKLTGEGKNIIGILPGNDNKMKDEAIMLGFSYNYTKGDRKVGIEKMKFDFEMLKKLSSMKRARTVIVAFWDGTLSDDCNGKIYYSKNTIYDPSKVVAYIDLTKINVDKSDSIYFNSDLSPVSRYFAWAFAHNLKNEFIKNTDVLNYDNIRETNEVIGNTPNDDEAMYYNGSMPVIIIANEALKGKEQISKNLSIDNIGNIVFKEIQENRY